VTESARQRRVREEGDRWEIYVAEFLKDCLSGEGYRVYREQDLPQGLRYRLSLEVPSLWDEIDLNAIGDTDKIFGDVDIVVAKDEEPLVIVSCKLSLHNRLTETLFGASSITNKACGLCWLPPIKDTVVGQNGDSLIALTKIVNWLVASSQVFMWKIIPTSVRQQLKLASAMLSSR
jgi:hypothetical protein